MKLFITAILIAIAFTSCHKNSDVKPDGGGNTITKTTPDTTVHISHDDSIHIVAFHVNPQMVTTSVSGSNLFMVFDENVDLLFNADGYSVTSSIHLSEDFTKTLLSGFQFTTVAEEGNTTLNWVDDNLNNVILKTVTDTVVNNQKMVKVNVHRPFTFFNVYNSAQDATTEQNVLLGKTNDTVTFSSYCYFNQKNYQTYSVKSKVVYTK